MNEMLIYKQDAKPILVENQNLGLYKGMIARNPSIMTRLPVLEWTGTVIDFKEFRKMLAFLHWSYAEHKVEAQGRMFYNEWTGQWRSVVLPQYVWSAGHTREVEDDDPIKENIKLKDKILEPLLQAGFDEAATIHHHSSGGAFQSSGDREDELSRNGFHMTVGHMAGKLADFHCRATLRKVLYSGDKGMIKPQQWLPGLHNGGLVPEVAKFWLDLENLPEFPEEWKEAMLEKPKVVATTHAHQYNNAWDQNARRGCGLEHWKSRTNPPKKNDPNDPRPFIFKQSMFGIRLRATGGKDRVIDSITPRTAIAWREMQVYGVHTLDAYIKIKMKQPKTEVVKTEKQEEMAFTPGEHKLDLSARIELYLDAKGIESVHMEAVTYLSNLTDLEFGCYISKITEDRKKEEEDDDDDPYVVEHLGIKFPAPGYPAMQSPDEQVAYLFACELASFRDDTIPSMLGADTLEILCSSLQQFTVKTLARLEGISENLDLNLPRTHLTINYLQDLMCEWMSRVLTLVSQDLKNDEREILLEACSGTGTKTYGELEDFEFYNAMCAGLVYAQERGRPLTHDYKTNGMLDVECVGNA